MARYILKTLYNSKHLERFDHRTPEKLLSILTHPRFDRADQTGPFGEEIQNPNKFEIFDSMQEKLFEGRIKDALVFVKSLK